MNKWSLTSLSFILFYLKESTNIHDNLVMVILLCLHFQELEKNLFFLHVTELHSGQTPVSVGFSQNYCLGGVNSFPTVTGARGRREIWVCPPAISAAHFNSPFQKFPCSGGQISQCEGRRIRGHNSFL